MRLRVPLRFPRLKSSFIERCNEPHSLETICSRFISHPTFGAYFRGQFFGLCSFLPRQTDIFRSQAWSGNNTSGSNTCAAGRFRPPLFFASDRTHGAHGSGLRSLVRAGGKDVWNWVERGGNSLDAECRFSRAATG